MEPSYLDRYKIIQTYKEDKFQKVFIGKNNENGQAVIINNIYIKENNPVWESIYQGYKNIFNNVVHFEKMDDEIAIITKIEEGPSLNEYLTDFNPSFIERINLIHQYLSNIKKYDPLPNNAKSVLIDKSQIAVIDGKISFNELILFNENTFIIEDFKIVRNNIVSVLQELLSLPHVGYKELPLYINIVEFMDKLRKNGGDYNSIEKISDEFENLNIGGLSAPTKQKNIVHPDNIIPSGKETIPVSGGVLQKVNSGKNYPLSIAIGAAGIITVALIGMLVFKSVLPLGGVPKDDGNIPSDSITDVNKPIEDEGPENFVSLGNDKTIEPNSDISYLSEGIEKDYTDSRYSDFSLKISDAEDRSHKITIKQGIIKAYSQFLMWVKSDTLDEFNITVEGYSDENLSFKKSILHKPLNVNSWEPIRFTLDKNIDDYVDIIFDNVKGTVWVDRISIDIFK